MNRNEVDQRLRQMRWPDPPGDLRARVLAQATTRPEVITWSDRVWFSRTWRVSMAAVAIAILAARAWPGPDTSASSGPSAQAVAEANAIEEAGRDLGLPDAVAASLARRALAPSRPRVEASNLPALPILDQ